MMWSKGKKILAASSILKGKAQFKPFSSTMNSVMKYLDKDKNFAQVIKTPEGQSSNIKESRVRNYLYTNINQDDYIPLSPWHGLPLQPKNAEPDVFQGLIEITRGTTAKMEVDTTDRCRFAPLSHATRGHPQPHTQRCTVTTCPHSHGSQGNHPRRLGKTMAVDRLLRARSDSCVKSKCADSQAHSSQYMAATRLRSRCSVDSHCRQVDSPEQGTDTVRHGQIEL